MPVPPPKLITKDGKNQTKPKNESKLPIANSDLGIKKTLDTMQETINTLKAQAAASAGGFQQLNMLAAQVQSLQNQLSASTAASGQTDYSSTAVSASVYAAVYTITAGIIGYLTAVWWRS